MVCGFEVLADGFGEDSGGGPDSDSGHRGQDLVTLRVEFFQLGGDGWYDDRHLL